MKEKKKKRYEGEKIRFSILESGVINYQSINTIRDKNALKNIKKMI